MKIIPLSRLWLGLFLTAWLWSCHHASGPTSQGVNTEEADLYHSRGQEISKLASLSLGKTLKKAIQEKGAAGAINFCKLKALPILDSLGEAHQVILRRATLKARNPVDFATPEEKKILDSWKELSAEQAENTHHVEKLDDQTILYARPIMVQALCLNCHGQSPQQIAPATMEVIESQYPDDQASGYKIGELRGMWSIRFYQASSPQPQ